MPISTEESRRLSQELVAQNPLATQRGFIVPRSQSRYWNQLDYSLPEPPTRESVMERFINDPRAETALGERTYFVITNRAPATVPLGVPLNVEESSLHVVQGYW